MKVSLTAPVSNQVSETHMVPSASLADSPKYRPQCGPVSLTPGTFVVPNKMHRPKATKLSQDKQFANSKMIECEFS